MVKSKIIITPMSTSSYLEKNEDGKPVDERKYRGMINYLLYLITSCPDIMFNVCMCAWFQASWKESHLSTIKHIMRYLSATQHTCL